MEPIVGPVGQEMRSGDGGSGHAALPEVAHALAADGRPRGTSPSGERPRIGFARWRRTLELATLVLALATFMWASWDTRGNLQLVTGDDTTYLALSEAVQQGTYDESFRPSAPPHVKYPPGYPAWLAVVRPVIQDRTDLVPAVNVALVAIALCIVWVVVRSIWGVGLALALVVSLSTVKGMLWMGGSYYSEALFVCLCAMTLTATWLAEKREGHWAYTAVMIAAAAFLTRAAGLSLVLAVGLWLVTSRRPVREWIFFGIVSAAVVGGWFAYVASAAQAAEGVRTYAYDLGPNPYANGPNIGIVEQVWGSVREYVLYAVPTELSLRNPQRATMRYAPVLLALYGGVPVGAWLLWKKWRAAACFLLIYFPMLIAFPYRDFRLAVPPLPLLVLTSLVGTFALTSKLSTGMRTAVRFLLPATMFLSGLRGANAQPDRPQPCDRTRPLTDVGCYGPIARDLISTARHLSTLPETAESALSWHAASLHLLTHRQVESALVVSGSSPDSLSAFLKARRIGYVLLTPVKGFERRELAYTLLKSCKDFTVEMPLENGSVLLRRSDIGAAVVPTQNACAAVEGFRARFPSRAP